MSSAALGTDPREKAGAPPRRHRLSRRRRRHGPLDRMWVRTHRWASLTLGLLLMVEVTTGAVLLYEPEISEALRPDLYASTPSATPMTPLAALRMVQDSRPELAATSVYTLDDGAFEISGEGGDAAFVDPGTGVVTGIGQDAPWILRLFVNIHDCGLTCTGYPGYVEWMTTPLPWISDTATIGGAILGVIGVVLLFLVVSGAVIWWPGIRGWITGFIVRRGRGPYVRDLDLHRVVGIVAVPFLFMWAFTGASFEFTWPEQVYFALLPGDSSDDPTLTPGTGPLITADDATTQVLALHPGSHVTALYETTPTEPSGSYGISVEGGATPDSYVEVDSHGGGVADYTPASVTSTPITQQLWDDNTYYDLHFGTIVSGWWRIVWLVFGLSPILLGITGVTIWLTGWRTRRNRARRKTAHP